MLPVVSYPYISNVEFLKEVRNVDGKPRKKKFKNNRIISPFYFFIKIKDIENSGELRVVFYEKPDEKGKEAKAVEKHFQCGEEGKYYEYIIFFDTIEGLSAGVHTYAFFFNDKLIYEGRMTIENSEEEQHQ